MIVQPGVCVRQRIWGTLGMRIAELRIKNFRSYLDFTLELRGESLFLIGENAGGKTTLLTAMARALGKDLSFGAHDFGNPEQPIEIEATVVALDEDQAAVLGDYIDFAADPPTLTVAVRATWDSDQEEADIEHYYPGARRLRSRRAERDALPCQYLPAVRDARRLLEFGTHRNLMGALVDSLPAQAALDDAVGSIRAESGRLGADPVFATLLRRARSVLADLLPDVAEHAFTMGIAAATARDLLRQFELVVQHLGDPIAVSSQSSGLSQLAIFAFVTQLATATPGAVLLVDEPEISLHPQAQRALMRLLRTLDVQMIVATHSSSLLDRADPRSIGRLRRTDHGVELARPLALSNEDARHLARFTSSQTAEAFFARTVVLVEGISDQMALESIAERQGRNLDAEGVTIVPMGGVTAITPFLQLYGPPGFALRVAGLCDANEEQHFVRAINAVGLGEGQSREALATHGFFVCDRDLEDELIQALGQERVLDLIDTWGDSAAFRTFRSQPTRRNTNLPENLHRFLSARKVEYAPRLADALALDSVPRPLQALLDHV